MSANRKFAFMFEDGNPFAAAATQIDVATLRDHFAAGLRGINSEAISTLLNALVAGALEPLTQDDNMKALWVTAGFKPEHLVSGAVAIVATGRGFGFAKTSKLPISQGKVGSDAALAVKAAIWTAIGNGKRHYNEKEVVAAKAAIADTPKPDTVDTQPEEPVKKTRTRKAKKQAETVELQQAA